MKIFFSAVYASPTDVPRMAREAEEMGYDGLWVAETRHDPFTGLALAAQTTSRISLRTGIAVAFARNPMTMASLASVRLVYRSAWRCRPGYDGDGRRSG